MVNIMDCKFLLITPPAAIVDNASLTTASIDTKGWDWLTVLLIIGATDIAMAALKLQTSDTDGSYGDLTGAIFGTSALPDGTTSALPAASGATGDNTIHAIQVNLKGKKRFFDLVATGGDGSSGAYFCAIAILSRGETSPSTAALRGFAQELVVG